jgi:hypothetical protein
LVALARQLVQAGTTVWVAGGPRARADEAQATGAVLNVWDLDATVVAARRSGSGGIEVTWAGPPPEDGQSLAARVRGLHDAGATWAVFGWPVDLGELVAAARAATESESPGTPGGGP